MEKPRYISDIPRLFEEWDYDSNKNLNPNELLCGSNKRAWWKCKKCGHKWESIINSRYSHNAGCPACAGRVPLIGINDIFSINPELKKEWDYDLNKHIDPLSFPKGSHKKVWWKCTTCGHKWEAEIRRRVEGSICPSCSNRFAKAGFNDLETTHTEIAAEWHPTKNNNLSPKDVVAGSNKKIWWKCSICNTEWKTSITCRTYGNTGCPKCHKHKNKNIELCFERTNPDLAKDWDYRKNGEHKPNQYRKGSNFLAWWKCNKCGYETQRTIHDYNGCPVCKKLNKYTENDILINNTELMKDWDYEKNTDLNPQILTLGSNKKAYWICSYCGNSWKTSIYNRALQGHNCTHCNINRRKELKNNLKKTHPELIIDWHPTKNIKLKPEMFTKNSKYEIWWKCNKCGKEIKSSIKTYNGCIDCKKEEDLSKSNLSITNKELIKEWNFEKNGNLRPEKLKNSNPKKVWWKCSTCGYEWEASIRNRASLGRGCPLCSNKVVVVGKNDLATTHPEIASEWHPTKNGELTPNMITHGTGKKVWWLCPVGHEYQAGVLHRTQENGTNCPVCNSGRQTSFVEQITFYYVKKLYPDAINRYKSDFLNRMELDIYIPSINCAIEYDGSHWHRKEKSHREETKYKICKEQNIKLIRLKERRYETDTLIADHIIDIPDKHTDKNFEKSIKLLLSYISSSNTRSVDVNIERDKFEILKYKMELKKDSLLTKFPEIAKEWHPTKNNEFKPSMFTSGSDYKAWWLCPICNYEYKTAISHRTGKKPTNCPKCSAKKRALVKARKVNMIDIKTNQIIKTFNSLSEAGRELNINSSNIGMVCRNFKRTAGGYKWEYSE